MLGPLPVTSSGKKYILVLVDQFTKWVEFYPMADQGAETTARKLVEEFISRWGCPLELHSDQGRNFQSELFSEVCKLLEITRTRTTPYRPSANGQVERYNRTLLQMLRCYIDKGQKDWDEHLPLLAAACRNTPNVSTGLTPNRLMLGREVHLPHDVVFGTAAAKREAQDPMDYMANLEEGLQCAQTLARTHLKAQQARQKRDYDIRAVERAYNKGDLVLLLDHSRKVGLSPKLQPKWQGPWVVVAQVGPVIYQIQGQKDKRVVHHDRLKPYTADAVPRWVARTRHRLTQEGSTLPESDASQTTQADPALPHSTATPTCPRATRDTTPPAHQSATPTAPPERPTAMTEDMGHDAIRTRSGRISRPPQHFGSC